MNTKAQSRASPWLLVLPVCLFLTGLALNGIRGPYWLGANSDPEYAYLLNALSLAESHPVGHYDHPGTPVQTIGALSLRVFHSFLSPAEDLPRAVLSDPEAYLNGINAVFLGINTAVLLALGMCAYSLTGSLGIALIAQSCPFLSGTALVYGLTRVSPEPLLLCAGLLLVIVLLQALMSARREWVHAMHAALVAGFGIAVKLNFLPLALIPLMVLRSWPARGLFVLGTGVSFFLFTFPIMDRYDALAQFGYRLLTRVGEYGSGNVGFSDLDTLWLHGQRLAGSDPAFLAILVLAIGSIIFSAATRGPRSKSEGEGTSRMLIGVAIAQALGFLLAAKYGKPHYLLPQLCLTALLLLLLLRSTALLPPNTHPPHNLPARSGLLGALLLVGLASTLSHLAAFHQERRSYVQNYRNLMATVDAADKDPLLVTYYGASSPLFALFFGDQWSGLRYSELLREIYGQAYFYNVWGGASYFVILSWTEEYAIESVFRQQGDRMLFQGAPMKPASLMGQTGEVLELVDLGLGERETLYAAKALTQAH